MGIVNYVCWVAIVALSAAWIIALADKWGIREWLQVHADAIFEKALPWYDGDFFNRLFSCDYCCSWWIAVIISLTLFVVTGEWSMLAIPFCSTMITRKLL